MELLPGIRMDGVDHQMGVKVLPVHMSCHQDLTAGEESLRQFQTDLMGLGGSKLFFRGEGLGVLVEEGSAGLSVKILGCQKTFLCQLRRAVDTREIAAAGFVHRLFLL